MEDNIWLRLITIGLVLSVLAVGYFLFSGRLISNSSKPSPEPTVLGQNTKLAVSPSPIPSPSPTSAYTRIVARNQSNIQTLPQTGFPVFLAVSFSVSAIISGWGLRKYPN